MNKRVTLLSALLLGLTACRGGIDGGGLTAKSNGSVAFMALAGMLIVIAIVLWIVLGRED
jgi:hypothetical protein